MSSTTTSNNCPTAHKLLDRINDVDEQSMSPVDAFAVAMHQRRSKQDTPPIIQHKHNLFHNHHIPMTTFPNEILALILEDVCQLHDDEFEFAHRFGWKPYITTTRIAALLVCRGWLHEARLLFYRTIILSTAAQASCLARTLSNQPNLGTYVRKLLFNGGYGASARKILQAAPRITHLCLSLGIRSSDSTRGLCESLQHIQPHSVRLNDYNNAHNNMHTRTLVTSICSCMKGKWTELIEFRFPYDIDRAWKDKEDNKRHLLEAMYDAPLLKIVHMPVPFNPHVLLPLLLKSSLSTIYSETPFGQIGGRHISGTSDQFPLQRVALCHKVRFPLPGPWASACRPYKPMQADSNNLRLMWRVRPPLDPHSMSLEVDEDLVSF